MTIRGFHPMFQTRFGRMSVSFEHSRRERRSTPRLGTGLKLRVTGNFSVSSTKLFSGILRKYTLYPQGSLNSLAMGRSDVYSGYIKLGSILRAHG